MFKIYLRIPFVFFSEGEKEHLVFSTNELTINGLCAKFWYKLPSGKDVEIYLYDYDIEKIEIWNSNRDKVISTLRPKQLFEERVMGSDY